MRVDPPKEPFLTLPFQGRERLLAFGLSVALTYLAASIVEPPVVLEAAWKAAGIILLAAYAFSNRAPIAGAALLFSAGGDIALALRPPVFIAGMALFGAGHALYIAAFLFRIRRNSFARGRAWIAGLVLLGSIALGAWIAPDIGALLIPGLAYQALLTAMVVCAFLAPVSLVAGIGAVSFMISDTMIGLGLYKHLAPLPGAIWIAYVAGQAMLAWALSRRDSSKEQQMGIASS